MEELKTAPSLIIFDLDGVLLEAKKTHYNALNSAIDIVTKNSKYNITWSDHLNRYDGLNTTRKLQKLSEERGLPASDHEDIWREKQDITRKELASLTEDEKLISIMRSIRKSGHKIACCSNSIRRTVYTALSKLGILEFFDVVVSNQDVTNPKPHPEMYWKAMSEMRFLPENTLILEDSPIGILASQRSGAQTLRVESPSQLSLESIEKALCENGEEMKATWSDDRLNVLIPMAGAGSRFSDAGYVFPKPLIEVNGKPMIQVVVENIGMKANYIFVVQKSHRKDYNLDTLLNVITENCQIIEVDGMTEGAACTALLAKDLINNDEPLFFANSDQFVEWDACEFMYKMQETESDGGIVTFESIHPKWSFAKVDKDDFVTEVAEKRPISNNATVGYYYWKKGSDFVKYAEQMIEEDKRVNGEFYVCPVFNEAINDNKKIRIFSAEKMWGLGTPHDLEYYLSNYRRKS